MPVVFKKIVTKKPQLLVIAKTSIQAPRTGAPVKPDQTHETKISYVVMAGGKLSKLSVSRRITSIGDQLVDLLVYI